MTAIRRASLYRGAAERTFPHGLARMVSVGTLTIGWAELRPGWRWSVDIKPLAGTRFCEIHHLQLLLAGRFAIRMESGEEAELEAGDVFEVPPGHDAWVIGDEAVVLVDVYGNVADFGMPTSPERLLATLLMTDIVDSTATAERLGAARWKQHLAHHNRVIRGLLDRHRGTEVNTTGDGFLATFTSPVAALRCAAAISEACDTIGLPVRIGVHTGEIDVRPDDVGGVAVHATARIMALGGASEVIVSATTRGLVDGSGLHFEARGQHRLKGLASPIEVFRLVRTGGDEPPG